MFKAPFSSNGRIRRTEYCLSIVIYFIIVGMCKFIAIRCEQIGISSYFTKYLIPIFYIGTSIFIIQAGRKRCHDLSNSGLYQFIPFYLFLMIFTEGNNGANRFGENPTGKESAKVFYENIPISSIKKDSSIDRLEQLENLKDLFDKNILTEEEFINQKRKILTSYK